MARFYLHGDSRPALSTSFHLQPEPFPRPTGHRASSSFHPQPSQLPNGTLSDAILGVYFARLHGKPFFVLDEPSTRQRHRLGQLPPYLAMAISALTQKYLCYEPMICAIADQEQVHKSCKSN